MKKLTFIVAAVAAMVFASCGNKTEQAAKTQDTVSFEQAQIEENTMMELDSIAEEWGKLAPVEGVFANGKIQLSDEELKAKPEYLLDLNKVNDLSLLSQKYRAIGIIGVDMKVAELYKMDTDAYKATIAKIATEINDPAIDTKGESTAETVKTVYAAEKENGRINLFWEEATSAVVEQLYVMSQNTEKFLPAFDDKTVADLTLHITLLKLSLDNLATYDRNIKELVDVLAPLNELNAISVVQFKEQLAKMKQQIEAARAALLK